MPGKYEIKRSTAGDYYFNLLAANGEVILTSGMYKALSGAMIGIRPVKTNSLRDNRYERRSSPSGRNFFVPKAGNYRAVGRSETDESGSARDAGTESVKKNGPAAGVVDLTR